MLYVVYSALYSLRFAWIVAKSSWHVHVVYFSEPLLIGKKYASTWRDSHTLGWAGVKYGSQAQWGRQMLARLASLPQARLPHIATHQLPRVPDCHTLPAQTYSIPLSFWILLIALTIALLYKSAPTKSFKFSIFSYIKISSVIPATSATLPNSTPTLRQNLWLVI